MLNKNQYNIINHRRKISLVCPLAFSEQREIKSYQKENLNS